MYEVRTVKHSINENTSLPTKKKYYNTSVSKSIFLSFLASIFLYLVAKRFSKPFFIKSLLETVSHNFSFDSLLTTSKNQDKFNQEQQKYSYSSALNINQIFCHSLAMSLTINQQPPHYNTLAHLLCSINLSPAISQPICSIDGTFDISNSVTNDIIIIEGNMVKSYFGSSVSSTGDFNGDGLSDFVIGAPGEVFDNDMVSKTYVIYGGANFYNYFNLSNLNGINGFEISEEIMSSHLGASVSFIGDFNGDGFDDIVIGGPFIGGYGAAGLSYVIYGGLRVNYPFKLSDLDGTNGFRVEGVSIDDLSGTIVSSAGDFNGDGYSDVMIYSPWHGITDGGHIYLIFGSPSVIHPFKLSNINGINGLRIDGVEDHNSGSPFYSMSLVGDANGDGLDDIIIGNPSGDTTGNVNAGQSYLVYGSRKNLHPFMLSNLTRNNGMRIDGRKYQGSSGASVSGVGDFNNDGFADILITGSHYSTGSYGSPDYLYLREHYLIYGSSTLKSVFNVNELDGSNGFRIDGASSQTKNHISSVGDINKDGFSDVVICSDYRISECYVVYGRLYTNHPFHLDALDGTNGFLITVPYSSKVVSALSYSTDINGDGYPEVVIGCSYANVNGLILAGIVYTISCAPTIVPTSVPTLNRKSELPTNYPTSMSLSTQPSSTPSNYPTVEPTIFEEYQLAKEITSLYLSGSSHVQQPSCNDRSPVSPFYHVVDIQSFMSHGPGRFAIGAQFELIRKFFEASDSDISVGNFTKSQMAQHFSLDYYGWIMQQYNFPDKDTSIAEFVERVYVFNSQEYRISNDAKFVVLNNGERRIENFVIEPSPENFDFDGGNLLTNLLNIYLESCIDPVGIGSTVGILYERNIYENIYSKDTYERDLQQVIDWAKYFNLFIDSRFGEFTSTALSMISVLPNSRHCRRGGFGWGEPHLVSHDGLKYDFQPPGEFILVGSNSDDLEIQVRQELIENSVGVSVNTAVAIYANGTRIGLYTTHPMKTSSTLEESANTENSTVAQFGYLFVNDTTVDLEFNELQLFNGLFVQRQGKFYEIVTPSGDGFNAVVYESHIDVSPLFSKNRGPGTVYGLLGNYDSNHTNDLVFRNGTILSASVPASVLYGEFADSWRVTNNNSLFVYQPGQNTSSFTDSRFVKRYVTINDFNAEEVASARTSAIAAGYDETSPIFKDIMLEVLVGVIDITDIELIPTNFTNTIDLEVTQDDPISLVPSNSPTALPQDESEHDNQPNQWLAFFNQNGLYIGLGVLSCLLLALGYYFRKKISQCFSTFFIVQPSQRPRYQITPEVTNKADETEMINIDMKANI